MEFENKEKLAIIRVLEKLAKADNKIMEEEMQVLIKVVEYLRIGEEQIRESKDLSLKKAGKILRKMDSDKRDFMKDLVIKLMKSDGVIDESQVRTLMEIFFGEDDSDDSELEIELPYK